MSRLSMFMLLLTTLTLTSCGYKDVEVKEIRNIIVTKFTAEEFEADVTVYIENPNWYKLSLTESDFDIYISGQHMGKGSLVNELVIPKKTSGEFTVTVQGRYSNSSTSILGGLLNILTKKVQTVRLTGVATGKAMMFKREVPFDFEEEFDMKESEFE